MSFFDSFRVERLQPDTPSNADRPPWHGPPRGVIPGYSSQRAVLASTDNVIVSVGRFACYPTGVVFSLDTWFRELSDYDNPPWELHFPRHADPTDDRFLRLGVLLADGSKWANFDTRRYRHDPPEPPVVWSLGGGGGERHWGMDQWLWPLPPEGPIEIFIAWPAEGITEQGASVDGSELRARAGESKVIWSTGAT